VNTNTPPAVPPAGNTAGNGVDGAVPTGIAGTAAPSCAVITALPRSTDRPDRFRTLSVTATPGPAISPGCRAVVVIDRSDVTVAETRFPKSAACATATGGFVWSTRGATVVAIAPVLACVLACATEPEPAPVAEEDAAAGGEDDPAITGEVDPEPGDRVASHAASNTPALTMTAIVADVDRRRNRSASHQDRAQ
jgi:hypothetical protein